MTENTLNTPRIPKVIIVGAGIGGLVAAAELAGQNCDVVVCERQDSVGGKMRQLHVGDRAIDVGPTVLTMKWVFDQIFTEIGSPISDTLTLKKANIIARHAWPDGSRLDLYNDSERSAEAIANFASERDAEGFIAFCKYAERVYNAAEHTFIVSPSPKFGHISKRMGKNGPRYLADLDAMGNMWRSIKKHFKDPRLIQLFGRYATYYGSSPFRAPGTLNLIAHVEQQGVWFVKGGIHKLALALKSIAEKRGARFVLGTDVTSISLTSAGRVARVQTANGIQFEADAVVVNADASAVATGRFGKNISKVAKPVVPRARSLSALTFAGLVGTRGFDLAGHNVFFSTKYKDEFRSIFARKRLPLEPTVYIRAEDRDEGRPAEPDSERIFGIINAPPYGDLRDLPSSEVTQCMENAFELMGRCGMEIHGNLESIQTTTPTDFDRLFPGTGGALYGPATHSFWAPMQRPAGKTRIPGLYLAGGSAHPGAGVPMAAMGGRQAAAFVLKDLGLTSLSPLRGTRGGT